MAERKESPDSGQEEPGSKPSRCGGRGALNKNMKLRFSLKA